MLTSNTKRHYFLPQAFFTLVIDGADVDTVISKLEVIQFQTEVSSSQRLFIHLSATSINLVL